VLVHRHAPAARAPVEGRLRSVPSLRHLTHPLCQRVESCVLGSGDQGSMHRLRLRPREPKLHPSLAGLGDGGTVHPPTKRYFFIREALITREEDVEHYLWRSTLLSR
jgi:hypothetical protein